MGVAPAGPTVSHTNIVINKRIFFFIMVSLTSTVESLKVESTSVSRIILILTDVVGYASLHFHIFENAQVENFCPNNSQPNFIS